jgi:hypothetical protein
LCLEIHDLILSKCVAGRERDWDYAAEAIRAGVADPDTLLTRVPELPVADDLRAHVEKRLRTIIALR